MPPFLLPVNGKDGFVYMEVSTNRDFNIVMDKVVMQAIAIKRCNLIAKQRDSLFIHRNLLLTLIFCH